MVDTAHAWTATDAEWSAFCKIGLIRSMTSPLFADEVSLAHEVGLLAPLLAGDRETVGKRASELIESLSRQIASRYPTPTPVQSPKSFRGQGQSSNPSKSDVSSHPPVVAGCDDTSDGAGATGSIVALAPQYRAYRARDAAEENAKKVDSISAILWGAGATRKDAKAMALVLWRYGFHIVRR